MCDGIESRAHLPATYFDRGARQGLQPYFFDQNCLKLNQGGRIFSPPLLPLFCEHEGR